MEDLLSIVGWLAALVAVRLAIVGMHRKERRGKKDAEKDGAGFGRGHGGICRSVPADKTEK